MPAKMEFHPLAELFPLMQGAEFDALAADIKEHGLREPILLHEDKILDGRNRYRACEAANVEPIYQDWLPEGTAQAFVVSKNLHRRHLNESQRALIAAQLANLAAGQHFGDAGQITLADAGALLNVSRASAVAAKAVITGGSPADRKAIEEGNASVGTIGRRIMKERAASKRSSRAAEPMSQTGKNPERIQKKQVNAEIWGRVREALTHLTSLPLPADVAAIARSNDRTGLVDARLTKAINWLKEFSDAWHDA